MTETVACLHGLTDSQSIHQLWARLCARMRDFGFDRLIYGATRFRTENSLGDPQDMMMLSSMPRAYMDSYIAQKIYLDAPMLRWALAHDGACSWSALPANGYFGVPRERLQRVTRLNRQFSVEAGYTVSFRSVSSRMKAAIGLIADPGLSQADVDRLWQRNGAEIELTATVAHLKALTLPYPHGRHLTERQRQVLEMVGDGKTTREIAQIVGVTPATVEKHMRLARDAMNVSTTAQAVLKASLQNQMFILPAES